MNVPSTARWFSHVHYTAIENESQPGNDERVKRLRLTYTTASILFEYPNIKCADFVVFQSQDPIPPMRDEAKKELPATPSLVFATIIIIRKENPKAFRRNPAGQKAEIARPLYVWSAVTRGSQKRQTTNKTPLRQMFINKHAPVPFTREQWQPRYLPSFLSNSNKAPQTPGPRKSYCTSMPP